MSNHNEVQVVLPLAVVFTDKAGNRREIQVSEVAPKVLGAWIKAGASQAFSSRTPNKDEWKGSEAEKVWGEFLQAARDGTLKSTAGRKADPVGKEMREIARGQVLEMLEAQGYKPSDKEVAKAIPGFVEDLLSDKDREAAIRKDAEANVARRKEAAEKFKGVSLDFSQLKK